MTAVVLAFPVAVVRRVNRKGYAVLIVPAELGRRQGRGAENGLGDAGK